MTDKSLQSQIDQLKADVESLKRSSTIPKPIENAFRERLGSISPTGKIGDVETTTITVLPAGVPSASGTIEIVVGSKTYNVLFQ